MSFQIQRIVRIDSMLQLEIRLTARMTRSVDGAVRACKVCLSVGSAKAEAAKSNVERVETYMLKKFCT